MKLAATRMAVTIVLLLAVGAPATASDQLVPGTRLSLRSRNGREQLRYVSKGAFSIPAAGGADDPANAGATFVLSNPGTGESFSFDLPKTHWSSNPGGTLFKYRDRTLAESDRVKLALVGGRALKVYGKRIGITLDEASQGALDTVLTVGSFRYCARYGDGSVRHDGPGSFGAKSAPPPAACPSMPGTTTTSLTVPLSTTTLTLPLTTTTLTLPLSTTTLTLPLTTTTLTLPLTTTTLTLPLTTTTLTLLLTTTTLTVPLTTTTTTLTLPLTTTTLTLPLTTTTLTLPVTTTTLPLALGHLAFTISPGTTSCGGPALSPPPAAPFSGEVDNLDSSKRADLGLGCLYFGGGSGTILPPSPIPDGTTSILAVTGINGLALTLGPDPGSGPKDCTLGAGPDHACSNGLPGTNGMGACNADADCAGVIGGCDLRANCYFGAPVPVPVSALTSLSTCIMNAIGVGAEGDANLLTDSTSVSTTLSSRVYVTGNFTSPCPQCVSGACSYGERAGLGCSAVGSLNTTIDCPPTLTGFNGRLAVALAPISTGTSTASDPAGHFCAGQTHPGAFGGQAGTIRETGSPLLGNLGNLFATTLAGTFCVPSTGNPIIDGLADLPGPGAVSVPGVASVQLPLL
jgi:hypothetical protein